MIVVTGWDMFREPDSWSVARYVRFEIARYGVDLSHTEIARGCIVS